MVKTFAIDYNEDYELLPIGKGKTDSKKLELLPSFVGQTEEYVRNWTSSRGITITVNESDSYLPRGSVVNQSLHSGTFVKNISHIMIYVSNGNVNSSNSERNDIRDNTEKNENDIIIDNEE